MIMFAFIAVVITLFLCLFALETDEDISTKLKNGQHGLWTWLISGNWPAKVGAILLIIGIAALMRYALIHVDVPDQVKLSMGVLLTAVIAFLSFLLREQPKQRALHLSLAGAACGVAYLTAYSAWGLFSYLDNITGLSLLVLVAGATGIFAIVSNSISIAILAMIGAYIAPAFAVDINPGPAIVYSYYAAVSVVSFLIVYLKGWRPLIHLSFLFTLIGGIFFAWSSQYYQAEYHSEIQPLLLLLTALHIAMPIIEGKASGSKWQMRFDLSYFVSLPIVVTILTYSIAPHIRPEFSLGLLYLGLLWAVAAITQYKKRSEVVRYAIVAFLFYVASAIAALGDVSFSLLGIFTMTVLLTMSTRLKFPEGFDSASSFVLLVFIGLWVVETSFGSGTGALFSNQWFAEHVAVSVLVLWSAYTCHKRNPIFSKVFLFLTLGILFRAVIDELLRLEFIFFAEIGHGLLVLALCILPCTRLPQSAKTALASILIFLLYLSVFWVVYDTKQYIAVAFLIIDIMALGFFVSQYVRYTDTKKESGFGIFALMTIPFFVVSWVFHLIHLNPTIETNYAVFTSFAVGILVSVIIGNLLKWNNDWSNKVIPYIYLFCCLTLGLSVLFHIERGTWPVVYEIITIVTLIFIVATNQIETRAKTFGLYTVISVAMVIQAMLLRYLGPDRIMTVADVVHMQYPAVVSLIWAGLGSLLAWWSGRVQSRHLWTVGSSLMVIAAVKLILVDFSSLGELGNILALIAAALAFLGVAWLVPIPPKNEATETVAQDDALTEVSTFNPLALLLIPFVAFVIFFIAMYVKGPAVTKLALVKSIEMQQLPSPKETNSKNTDLTKQELVKSMYINNLRLSKEAKFKSPPRGSGYDLNFKVVEGQITLKTRQPKTQKKVYEELPDVVKQGLGSLPSDYSNNEYSDYAVDKKSKIAEVSKSQQELREASSTWGGRLNTNGYIPKDTFKAFYFNMKNPTKVIFQETVKNINVDYSWSDFHGIKSQEFGAYWVSKFETEKTVDQRIYISQSWANVRLIIDKNIIYNYNGSDNNKVITYTLEPGIHLIEVEYTNHWHTTEFQLAFL